MNTLLFYLAYLKRFLVALRDTLLPVRDSYAQHGEDAFLSNLLAGYNLRQGIYVEVGANQPTQISNTYLFYRQGYNGVLMEPSRVVTHLLRWFRPRDICLPIGCSDKAGVLPFTVSQATVTSSFVAALAGVAWKSEYVPVLSLDTALAHIPAHWVYLLSIDTEGFDLKVLQGAGETLAKTFLLVVEDYEAEETNKIDAFIRQADFEFVQQISCNRIYRNRRDFDAYRASQ